MVSVKKLIFITVLALIFSCKGKDYESVRVTAERIAIDSKISPDTGIANYLQPYKEHLKKTLDSVLAYNPRSLSKSHGELNTAIGNLLADIVMEQASPVFRQRTGKDIDMVLLNYGGIRSTLNQGKVTARTAYALMPFENEIVVAQLQGAKIYEILQYLENARTAHPVNGVKIGMDNNYKITRARINNEEIDSSKTYYVATSDYLQQGGDNMNFFSKPMEVYNLDYKLRNAIIDYFKKVDTIRAERDDRFIRLNETDNELIIKPDEN